MKDLLAVLGLTVALVLLTSYLGVISADDWRTLAHGVALWAAHLTEGN